MKIIDVPIHHYIKNNTAMFTFTRVVISMSDITVALLHVNPNLKSFYHDKK